MNCAWQAYLNILPHWMRTDVDNLGKDSLQETRLRIGQPPELCFQQGSRRLVRTVCKEDITFVIHTASAYSAWAAGTIGQGYITATGGHRVGICGGAVIQNGRMTGISEPVSLCIRAARDFPNIAKNVADLKGSVLIIGPPGCGKTTLLRDLIRQKSNSGQGSVAVIDEREEIFPVSGGQSCFLRGERTDILWGCPKASGMESVLRSMNPTWIAIDEVTAKEDTEALLHAGWCGVHLLATAHAGSLADLKTRPIYQLLIQYRLFDNVIILQKDKTWRLERFS